MILTQIETELANISHHLRSITVEIANRHSGGSGVIWSENGVIVTNSHVAIGSKVQVKLATGNVTTGSIIARDFEHDLAAIQVEVGNLPTPTIGNIEALRPGEVVLAMGNPWGFSGTLTTGVIHSLRGQTIAKKKLDRSQQIALTQNLSSPVVVADIRLAPGNSGGVLANVRGEVIGINTAIFQGLALAIPAQQISAFVGTISQ